MATIYKSSKKKVSRLRRIARMFNPRSLKGGLALFALVFAITGGGYYAYRSLAATEVTYMRVMTWNVRYGGVRMSTNLDEAAILIASKIRSVNVNGSTRDPDIVFLQEMYDHSEASRNLTAKIAAILGMNYQFAGTVSNVTYSTNEDGRYARNGLNYGHAILSKFSLKESEALLLSSPGEPRKALKARTPVGYFTIRLVGSHFSSGSQDPNGSYRALQAQEIIDRYGKDGNFTIFAGDTNSTYSYSAMVKLKNAGFGGIYSSLPTIDAQDPSRQIDYILSRNLPANTAVRTFRVNFGSGASDHAALVADYYFR